MEKDKVRVQCNDYPLSKVIDPDEGILPTDIIIEHGQETGHILTVKTGEEITDNPCRSDKSLAEQEKMRLIAICETCGTPVAAVEFSDGIIQAMG